MIFSWIKLSWIVSVAISASVHAGEVIDSKHDYMYFPDSEGVPHLIDLKQKGIDLTGFSTQDPMLRRNVKEITFNLFTRNNPTESQLLVLDSVSSLRNSNWDSSRLTRFITHGWRSSKNSKACTIIRDAYLEEGDYNIIIIDWSSIAKSLYTNAAPSVPGVASHVASMIDFLNSNAGLDLNATKLIGHSLGGHVVGLAARNAKGTIGEVISLDPALPLFNLAGPGSRIDRTDADYVQVIHTNGGGLGMMRAVGDTDFYPNGGRSQPGCGLDFLGNCSHFRAYYYFAESIQNPTGFRATGIRSSNLKALDQSFEIFMGGPVVDRQIDGSFTLTTNRASPFALG